MIHGLPGPGGSLGQCAVCGETFITETVLSMFGSPRYIRQVSINNIDGDVCIHEKCMAAMERARDDGWETLPEGPLRKVFAEAAAQLAATEDG